MNTKREEEKMIQKKKKKKKKRKQEKRKEKKKRKKHNLQALVGDCQRDRSHLWGVVGYLEERELNAF